jgi:GWxTD domain-containing protein
MVKKIKREVLTMLKSFCRLGLRDGEWIDPSIPIISFSLVLFLCLFASVGEVLAQDSPGSPHVRLDYACFRNLPDTSQSYVEIYLLFSRKELKFIQEGETYQAKLFLNLTIEDKLGDMVESRMWNHHSAVNRWEETQTDYMILDQAEVLLEPGDYVMRLSATDLSSEAKGETSLELKVEAFGERSLQLSDLELAFQVEPDTGTGRFMKAGRKILPNPSGVFSHGMGIVYFYAELYNLAVSFDADSDYVLSFFVSDSTGKKVKDFGSQTRKKPGNSAVVLSGINISVLPQGDYVLQIEAEDKETKQKALAMKNFTILGGVAGKKESLASAEEVETFKQDVAYVGITKELEMFDQLTPEGKRRFIIEFWRKRDPNPDTPINEFKIEHYRRIGYANSNFSRIREANDGWNTDMGRIYILHGEPSEIERYPVSAENKSWEQWNYNELEGGVYFIFLDEDGYGVYRLIHSNLRGEVKDYQWEEKVRRQSPFR